jgi:uncharacterized cupredoxin-like copper-binding protein
MRTRVVLIAAVVAATFVTGPIAPAGAKTSTVNVKLSEFLVKPKPKSIAAGKVKFSATNIGSTEHEMVIARTDGKPLPTKADGSVDEAAVATSIIGEIGDLKSKKTKSVTEKLNPGGYVLFCNIVQTVTSGTLVHYARGMYTTFTVK